MPARFVDQLRARTFRDNWGRSDGMLVGYYLCLPDGTRRWFGGTLKQAKAHFDNACDQYLTAKAGWQYGVEYSHGPDAKGNAAWDNLDLTDRFV